jgi:hypothetical protein
VSFAFVTRESLKHILLAQSNGNNFSEFGTASKKSFLLSKQEVGDILILYSFEILLLLGTYLDCCLQPVSRIVYVQDLLDFITPSWNCRCRECFTDWTVGVRIPAEARDFTVLQNLQTLSSVRTVSVQWV